MFFLRISFEVIAVTAPLVRGRKISHQLRTLGFVATNKSAGVPTSRQKYFVTTDSWKISQSLIKNVQGFHAYKCWKQRKSARKRYVNVILHVLCKCHNVMCDTNKFKHIQHFILATGPSDLSAHMLYKCKCGG